MMKWFGTEMLVVVFAVMVATLITVEVQHTQAAKILIAAPVATRSHHNLFMSLAEHLVQRNHTVTYVTGIEIKAKSPNIQMLFVPNANPFEKMPNLFTTDSHVAMMSIFKDMQTACNKALVYEDVQKLNEEEFDLVIAGAGLSECFTSFAYKLQIPFIFVMINKVTGAYASATGTPFFPSLVASFLLDLEYPLTFKGRMISALYDLISVFSVDFVYIPNVDAECRALKLCPDDMPPLTEFRLKNSLMLLNSVRTMENPTLPDTPTVVHIGGIHCRPAQPLPEDLQQWFADAGEPGVIFFSLGSFVKPSTMPEEYRRILVEVIGSLQQQVLWKWDEDTMEGLPSNVRLSKWLPQQDILGHPQLKLFITHGGLFSTQEATYHGVPVIGLPVSIDQHHNMRQVQQEGWGRVIHWEDLTYERFRTIILEVMDDKRIKTEVERRKKLMLDQPMSPGDWASYWVEYVLRHNGAYHLRSPAMDIPWYQLYNFDVWAVVVVVTMFVMSLVSWLNYKIFRAIIVWCCRHARKTKKD